MHQGEVRQTNTHSHLTCEEEEKIKGNIERLIGNRSSGFSYMWWNSEWDRKKERSGEREEQQVFPWWEDDGGHNTKERTRQLSPSGFWFFLIAPPFFFFLRFFTCYIDSSCHRHWWPASNELALTRRRPHSSSIFCRHFSSILFNHFFPPIILRIIIYLGIMQ